MSNLILDRRLAELIAEDKQIKLSESIMEIPSSHIEAIEFAHRHNGKLDRKHKQMTWWIEDAVYVERDTGITSEDQKAEDEPPVSRQISLGPKSLVCWRVTEKLLPKIYKNITASTGLRGMIITPYGLYVTVYGQSEEIEFVISTAQLNQYQTNVDDYAYATMTSESEKLMAQAKEGGTFELTRSGNIKYSFSSPSGVSTKKSHKITIAGESSPPSGQLFSYLNNTDNPSERFSEIMQLASTSDFVDLLTDIIPPSSLNNRYAIFEFKTRKVVDEFVTSFDKQSGLEFRCSDGRLIVTANGNRENEHCIQSVEGHFNLDMDAPVQLFHNFKQLLRPIYTKGSSYLMIGQRQDEICMAVLRVDETKHITFAMSTMTLAQPQFDDEED